MKLQAQHIFIRRMELEDADQSLALRIGNREFMRPFEPIQAETQFTLEGQIETMQKVIQLWEKGCGYGFGIFLSDTNELIGRVNLSNVVRGAWDSCTMGYFMDQRMNGHGYTTEAVRLAMLFAFEEAGLHRIQAAVMPRNSGSIRVVQKAGFLFEGLAEYYLKINGIWEHHNIYSSTREYWPNAPH